VPSVRVSRQLLISRHGFVGRSWSYM